MSVLTRREFYAKTGGIFAAMTFGGLAKAAEEKGRRFNILFLMTDQHTHGVMGCAGNPVVKTPHLDALAAGGARFTQATCVTPFCSPTRASLITGRWPHSHGIVGNVPESRVVFKEPFVCTENILFDRGFATARLGKWHLGRERDLRCYPGAETKSESQARYRSEVLEPLGAKALDSGPRPGEVAGGQRFMTEAMAAVQPSAGGGGRKAQKAAKSATKTSGKTGKKKGDAAVAGEEGAADGEEEASGGDDGAKSAGRSAIKPEYSYEWWLADQAIALLEQNKDRNFMLTLSVSPPHAPWFCPAPYYDMYKPDELPWPPNMADRPAAYQKASAAVAGRTMGEANIREYLRAYYGQVTMMDAVFGRVLDALKRLGLEEDTLVVYTSDHGDLQGAHGFVGKVIEGFYDEVVRVPLIVRYPRQIKAGTVLNCAANSVDLMPTLLDYAGAPIPANVQGRSLRPVIEGKEKDEYGAAFCERGLGERFGRMVRTAEAKYCYYSSGRHELFDLVKDPHELRDVAGDASYRALRDRMSALLLKHAQETGDPVVDKLPKA